MKISNYVPPHCYNRYHTLQAHCKTAHENDDQLRTKIIYGTSDLILQEKKVGELRYTTVNINKYGELPPINLSLMWPTHELEVPLTTPPKGRPQTQTQTPQTQTLTQTQQKRQHSSPETISNTSVTTVKNKRHKKSKKKINAESSISDHNNSSDEENSQTNEVARMHQIITGKRSYTKKDCSKKLDSITRNTL